MKEKWLHNFEVEKTQKVKETTTEVNEAGEEVQITREVEKKVPHKFYILKPNRKIQDEASIFYSVKVSEGIKLGLVTKNYLLRKFQQDGILASEDEKKAHCQCACKSNEGGTARGPTLGSFALQLQRRWLISHRTSRFPRKL